MQPLPSLLENILGTGDTTVLLLCFQIILDRGHFGTLQVCGIISKVHRGQLSAAGIPVGQFFS